MCCLFGLMDYRGHFNARQKTKILSVLSKECEARGTDATGIAYNSRNDLKIYKRPLAAHKLRLLIPDDARTVMGHTRMTTQGDEKRNYNNHPFRGMADAVSFALAHNGVLQNDLRLRKTLKLPDTKIETDSYIAVQLIEHKRALDLDTLAYMAGQIEGSFCFTVLDEKDNLYFIKGDNPLCIYQYPRTGLILYASLEEYLTKSLTKLKLPMEEPRRIVLDIGEILKISPTGVMNKADFDTTALYRSWYAPVYYWPYRDYSLDKNTYVDELKSIAGSFGYTSDDVDTLLGEGFSPEELEEYFYEGEW